MSGKVERDTVIKFCNFVSDDAIDRNGNFGLVRKQLENGNYRIMQTSGRDISVKRDNFEIVKIDLNENVENGVVLVFPPSTGRTGIKPVAVPLPDFPYEVMHPAMGPFTWDFEKMVFPPEMMKIHIRYMDVDNLLTTKEITLLQQKIVEFQCMIDMFEKFDENPTLKTLANEMANQRQDDFKLTLRFMKCRYNNEIRRIYCVKNFGWEIPKRLQTYDDPEDYAAELPASVYWYDGASNGGIENTFMRFTKKEGDDFRGAVVFDLSTQKFKLDQFKSIREEHDFDKVKTVRDFQNYIVKIQVNAGEHPSNPWSDTVLEMFGDYGKQQMKIVRDVEEAMARLAHDDPEKWKRIQDESAAKKKEQVAEKTENEKKQRLKDKIKEKRLKRTGLR